MGIFKRKGSDFYWLDIIAGGTRIRESAKTKNKKEAEAIYAKRYYEIANGIVQNSEPVAEKNRFTFDELAKKYLSWVYGKQASYGNKKSNIENYFLGRIKYLDEIKTYDLEKIQSEMIAKELARSYINKCFTTFKHMFTKALDWEMIDETVLQRIRRVKNLNGANKILRYLAKEEIEALVSSCPPHLKPIVLTALNTGMRKSEILHLTWDRIDLKNRLILLDKTKNGERREIPMNNVMIKLFSSLPRHLRVPYVFYNNKLKPYKNVSEGFQTALKKSGIKNFRFHDLRHTFASTLVMAGVDISSVSELLGHTSIKMTQRYTHLSPAHLRKAVEIFENVTFSSQFDENRKVEDL